MARAAVDRGDGRGIKEGGLGMERVGRSGEEESHSPINVRKGKGSTGPQGAKQSEESHPSVLHDLRSALSSTAIFSDTRTKNGTTC
jgi:hypothetical protein